VASAVYHLLGSIITSYSVDGTRSGTLKFNHFREEIQGMLGHFREFPCGGSSMSQRLEIIIY
jgi:hypothetical protein